MRTLRDRRHRSTPTRKSPILVALGVAAAQAGHKVRYFTASDLVETLYRALADNSVGRTIDTLLRNGYVIVDELGFAPLHDTGAQLLFRFVAAAYERRSLGIGPHRPFESWGRFLPEHTTAVSLLDRLLHHCRLTGGRAVLPVDAGTPGQEAAITGGCVEAHPRKWSREPVSAPPGSSRPRLGVQAVTHLLTFVTLAASRGLPAALRIPGPRPLAGSTGVTQHGGMSADFKPGRERLRTIEREDCARLLNSVRYGRLAIVDGERPLLVVLNHLVERGNIYFRTRTDARLAHLTEGGRVPPAVFEVDGARSDDQSGWSVMATGLLHREYGETRPAQLRSRLEPWAEGVRDLILCLEVHELTGRRVGAP